MHFLFVSCVFVHVTLLRELNYSSNLLNLGLELVELLEVVAVRRLRDTSHASFSEEVSLHDLISLVNNHSQLLERIAFHVVCHRG
jgi:hypothetical protein